MTQNSTISENERRMLEYLGQCLKPSYGVCEISDSNVDEWERIYALADRHEVSVLISIAIMQNYSSPPNSIR